MTKLTTKWKTIAIVGFTACLNDSDPNRPAHGGVCLLQARKGQNGVIGRKVNSNGRAQEIGKTYKLDEKILAQWEEIAKGQ